MRNAKVGRNDPCPCGRLKKFKQCCEGKVDWEKIFRSGADPIPHLSIRGRNIGFVNGIWEALQLDTENPALTDYKAAFTADAVRRIHETLVKLWPRDMDIASALAGDASEVS